MNSLYYGDNLDILRTHIPDASVDLVYLDPPFNSQATYNVLFRAPTGEHSTAQIEAFEDSWHWNETTEDAFDEILHSGHTDVAELVRALRAFLKENDMMAYLTMMAIRLIELHRVLKPTGSIYLHCDPTASHYLKLLMDAVFSHKNFRNEVIWKRTSSHSDARQGSRHYGRITDTILFYAKDTKNTWNPQHMPYDPDYIVRDYRRVDPDGRRYRISDLSGPGGAAKGNPSYEFLGITRHWRYNKEKMEELYRQGRIIQTRPGVVPQYKRYLDEMPGMPVQNLWADLPVPNNRSREVLGYPTQKPKALLERIIKTSSNEGDTVLDPFCGCGTTIHAAAGLQRQWIGIDITHLAIGLIERRLKEAFPGILYEVHGTPKDVDGAKALATLDPYQFQWWAISLIEGAVPYGGRKRGADTGIDGLIYFKPNGKDTDKAIISVKGGANVSVAMVRDLAHVVDREQAKLGVFLTLTPPTKPMQTEAVKAGFYETPYHGKVPKMQILTIANVLVGKQPQVPFLDTSAVKRARQEAPHQQERLF